MVKNLSSVCKALGLVLTITKINNKKFCFCFLKKKAKKRRQQGREVGQAKKTAKET